MAYFCEVHDRESYFLYRQTGKGIVRVMEGSPQPTPYFQIETGEHLRHAVDVLQGRAAQAVNQEMITNQWMTHYLMNMSRNGKYIPTAQHNDPSRLVRRVTKKDTRYARRQVAGTNRVKG